MNRRTLRPVKILVVDDDAVDRSLIDQAFSVNSSAVELRYCKSGSEALELLLKRGDLGLDYRPDLCMFDINMHGLTGIELLERCKANSDLSHIPIIMLSSSDDESDMRACYELNAAGYLCKPDSFNQLQKLLDGFATYWLNTVSFPKRVVR